MIKVVYLYYGVIVNEYGRVIINFYFKEDVWLEVKDLLV